MNTTRPDQRFRKSERLRLKRDFARVFAARRRAPGALLTVYVDENDLAWSRLGMSVGRRVGNAVTRNRVRRRLREAFRLQKDKLPVGLDIICVVHPAAADPNADLATALRDAIHRAARKPHNKNKREDK